MRRTFLATCILGALALSQNTLAQQTAATETAGHPRIAAAIRQLEDAIQYMQAAPHDFGGHKAKAIEESRKAINQLQAAMKYRANQDNRKGKKK
jgi:thermostable 8-oxoguanine DNA glycosylase